MIMKTNLIALLKKTLSNSIESLTNPILFIYSWWYQFSIERITISLFISSPRLR